MRALVDGISAAVLSRASSDVPRHADVWLRDFEIGVTGRPLIERDVDEHSLVVAIACSDGARSLLRDVWRQMRWRCTLS